MVLCTIFGGVGKNSLGRGYALEIFWGKKYNLKKKKVWKIAKAAEILTSETDKKELCDWKYYAKD